MLPNQYENNVGEERKREFKRQQDRLKMMAPDSDVSLLFIFKIAQFFVQIGIKAVPNCLCGGPQSK